MNICKKHIVLLSVAFLLIAIPAVAQVGNGVNFNAPFAFYAGNAKMPAGSYKVTQPDVNDSVLLIEDVDGSHSAFVEYLAVNKNRSTQPISPEVGFKKYGTVDFLSRITFPGDTTVLRISQAKAEERAAKTAAAEEHSVAATGGLPAANASK